MKKLSNWAKEQGISYNAAYRLFKYGQIPNSQQLSSGTIIINEGQQTTQTPIVSNLAQKFDFSTALPMEGNLFGDDERKVSKAASRHNRGAFDAMYNRYVNIDNGYIPVASTGGKRGNSGTVSNSEIITLCQKAYFNFSVVRNIVDVLTEFSCNNIYFKGGNTKSRKFFEALFKKINLGSFQDKFFREYYRSGNIFTYRFDIATTTSDANKITQIYGANATRLPVKYIILDPANIEITGASSFINNQYNKILSSYEIGQLRKPQTEEDKAILNNLPSETQEAIKNGSENISITLNQEKVKAVFYKKQDYEAFAVPMIFPVLDDIEWKSELKKMDQHIARTIQQAILLITLGYEGKDGSFNYNTKLAEAYKTIFQNESVGRVLIGDFTVKADFIIPQVADILDPKKYEVVNEDIRAGLNDILFGGSSSEKFANQTIKMQVFIERLRSGREVFLNEFLVPEIKRISKELGFQNFPTPYFEEIDLKDEVLYAKIYTQLAQLGYLTPEETFKAMETGILPDSEASIENQTKFKQLKDKGLYEPLTGNKGLNPEGRQEGTKVSQDSNKKSPVGTPKVDTAVGSQFSAKKVISNTIAASKLEELVKNSIKSKYKIKQLTTDQETIVKDLTSLIMTNEISANWTKETVKEYIKSPIDKNKDYVKEVIDLGYEFQLDNYWAAILINSKI